MSDIRRSRRSCKSLFIAHAAGRERFAVTTVTLAEVLTGPLQAGGEALAERYRATPESWLLVELTADMVANAARLHASLRLRLADAVQATRAITIDADGLVTDDREFSRARSLRVLP